MADGRQPRTFPLRGGMGDWIPSRLRVLAIRV